MDPQNSIGRVYIIRPASPKENSQKFPHMPARFHCHANEKSSLRMNKYLKDDIIELRRNL